MNLRDRVEDIIAASPGISGYDLYGALVRQSRSARWFGERSMLTVLLGPSLVGMYNALSELEGDGRIRSIEGAPMPERGNRPRTFYFPN